MTADAFTHAGLIVAIGLAVGWGAAASGLGAGLSMPLLATCGLALPSALLAVKLPVTISDIAAALGESRRLHRTRVDPEQTVLRGDPRWRLRCAAAAGALAGWAVLRLPPSAVAIGAPMLALLALALHQTGRGRPRWVGAHALVWGAYVGGCGIGASLLWRSHAHWTVASSVPNRQHHRDADSGTTLRAAANIGALTVLLAAGQKANSAVLLLAAAQGAGAWLATRFGHTDLGFRRLGHKLG